MSYCINCGRELRNDDRYCPLCGQRTDNQNGMDPRGSSYNGRINRCPNCGSIIPSFTVNCPSCGYELRGIPVASSSIQLFSEALLKTGTGVKGAEEKARIIRSYPVPNTKEDIIEFLTFSVSGINTRFLSTPSAMETQMKASDYKAQTIIISAWIGKLEELRMRAQLLFPNDPAIMQIQAIVTQKEIEIKKAEEIKQRRENPGCLKTTFLTVFLIILVLGMVIGLFVFFGYLFRIR